MTTMNAYPLAVRDPMAAGARTGGLAPGRWTVDATRSRLLLDARVCGMVGVRGRFTELSGHVDVAADPQESRIHIDVLAASLTSGSARRDAVLTASGLVDPAAGPFITFRSRAMRRGPAGGWQVLGMLSTARGGTALGLELAAPPVEAGGRVRLHARGRISRDDIAELLTRPGAACLLGPTADLDLHVELTPPAPARD